MQSNVRNRVSLANPVHFLALGFGSGLSPLMPGTVGTLAAIPVVALMLLLPLSAYLGLTLAACLLGIWLCDKTATDMNVHDHPGIVWDEFAGLMVTMIAVPLGWQSLLAGFLLFRAFDILKPWPISYLDSHIHGGLGIMLDDILAGVMAAISLQLLLYYGLV